MMNDKEFLDHMAGQALTGFLANPNFNEAGLNRIGVTREGTTKFVAIECYAYAVAMLRLRQLKQTETNNA